MEGFLTWILAVIGLSGTGLGGCFLRLLTLLLILAAVYFIVTSH